MATKIPKVETLNYRPGGFHPVHIDDTFKKGRYIVIHKLGHGGFATVWLARDTVRLRYVALKILAARLSKDCPEVEMLRRLRNSGDHIGKGYVMSLLDHFFINGPNGHHLCVVGEVGGPSIKQFNECPGLKSGTRRLRGEAARMVALQATEGLAFIHDVGIVHGDFTAANILLQLANIDEWTIDEIHQRLGVPQTQDLHRTSGSSESSSGPRYTVKDISMKHVDPKWVSDHIMIIDFGIAFLQSETSPDIGTPKAYCAPEFLFKISRSVKSDIWALGCTIFEIRAGCILFRYHSVPTRDEILMQVVEMLGKLPDEWWKEWEKGREWYNNEAKEGGELARTILGTLHQDIMEIGLHDGDAATPPFKRISTSFAKSVEEAAKIPHNLLSKQHQDKTDRLLALVDEITTSDAADVIFLVNKSLGSEATFASGSPSGSGPAATPISGSGSRSVSSNGSANKIQSGSGTSSSKEKSGEKSVSSEGITTGGSQVALHPNDEKSSDTVQDRPRHITKLLLEPVRELLEEEGTTITDAEGISLEDLLRRALRLLPEERPQALELANHAWFAKEEREIH